jgi:hypothetical protein
MSTSFHAHCVDSWVLAWLLVGGDVVGNKSVHCVRPMQKHYRRLHVVNPICGGVRKKYGSTISLGFVRGSIVKHDKYGVATIGGTSKGRVSLHSVSTGARITTNARCSDVNFKCFNSFIFG